MITAIVLCAFACACLIASLEVLAIQAGLDGIALSAAIGSIAAIASGLIGWVIPTPRRRKPK